MDHRRTNIQMFNNNNKKIIPSSVYEEIHLTEPRIHQKITDYF